MEKIYNFYTLSVSSDAENIRYVGVTTKSVIQRFYGHRYCAMHDDKRGLPVHKWMYSHYEKGETIVVKQIDTCNENEWEEREKYWIKYYKDNGFDLLNISEGGKGVVTEEMRSKSSIERSIGAHCKAVVALNKDGSFYKEFESIKEASEFTGALKTSIGNVLKGRSKSSKGYIWVYKEDYDPNKEYSYKPKSKAIPVYAFDIDGIPLCSYPSMDYFDTLDGWSTNGVRAAIKDKKLYHNKYWATTPSIEISEYEPFFYYQELDDESNLVELYRTQLEIAEKFNISPGTVCTRIKNKSKFGNNTISKL